MPFETHFISYNKEIRKSRIKIIVFNKLINIVEYELTFSEILNRKFNRPKYTQWIIPRVFNTENYKIAFSYIANPSVEQVTSYIVYIGFSCPVQK